ncbi:hypothetical protein ACPPVU_10290 [Mucilaginibacter sp. McL0603]|uniref:hypothetical protein n=1 Tax=Mucilaginibacter sp. McL0603 TaxID=3415670 RepID=UPI003CFB327F
MALPHQKQSPRYLSELPVLPVLLILVLLQSCSHEKKIYKSNCNDDKTFTRITFKHLMDSLDDYDQQYVEVSGKYIEDKDLSALFNDSLFVDHSNKNALWVDFSQECPLYLSGTHTGLFEYNDGSFTQINNKSVTIRGMIVFHPKKKYKATLERISLVKL